LYLAERGAMELVEKYADCAPGVERIIEGNEMPGQDKKTAAR